MTKLKSKAAKIADKLIVGLGPLIGEELTVESVRNESLENYEKWHELVKNIIIEVDKEMD